MGPEVGRFHILHRSLVAWVGDNEGIWGRVQHSRMGFEISGVLINRTEQGYGERIGDWSD